MPRVTRQRKLAVPPTSRTLEGCRLPAPRRARAERVAPAVLSSAGAGYSVDAKEAPQRPAQRHGLRTVGNRRNPWRSHAGLDGQRVQADLARLVVVPDGPVWAR